MVIQRWQSVLLLFAALVMGCFTFASLGQVQTTDYSLNFTTMGFSYEGEATDGAPTGYMVRTWFFFILSLMTSLILLINIFLFKNLRLQKTVCWVAILFIIASASVGAALGYTAIGTPVSWSTVAICPLLAVILVILAYRRINHDHKLLTSAYRLR